MAVDNRTENRNYPLPDPENNLDEDVLRLIAALEAIDADIVAVAAAVAAKANAEHQHEIDDITGLQDALDGKAASDHEHGLNDLTDVDVSEVTNGQFLKRVGTKWSPATPQIGDISGLQAALEELAFDIGSLDAIVVLKGTWDASTGSFPGGGSAKAGWSYIVSTGGTVGGVEFSKDDRIVAITDNASTSTYAGNWHKLDYTDQVLSVAGKTGNVILGIGDIGGLWEELGSYVPLGGDGKVSPEHIRRVGEFFWYFGENPPDYALVCDGSAISRTTYADLWAFAQASGNLAATEGSKQAGQFGPGNGSTTFTLPDLRGEFVRGWDNGRGVDTGRSFGTWQADELKSHTHTYLRRNSSTGINVSGTQDGILDNELTTNTGSAGGNETRPRNVALLPCIVY